MGDEKLLSVIVPIHNIEEYVGECIESIRRQKYTNLEIILVNDGSTDRSGEICREYAAVDKRILYVSQKKGGVAKARKNGALRSHGQLITFVDGDDFLDDNFFYDIMKLYDGEDVITAGFYRDFGRETFLIPEHDNIPEGRYDISREDTYIMENFMYTGNEMGVQHFLWAKLYKRELAEQCFEYVCPNITMCEDFDFVFKYMVLAKSVRSTRVKGYHYRQRQRSAIHTVHIDYLEQMGRLYQSLYNFFKESDYEKNLIPQLEKFMLERMYIAARYMGFDEKHRLFKYIFTDVEKTAGRRIILYGAGAAGIDYYRQLIAEGQCEIVAWVDRDYKKKNIDRIKSPKVIYELDYDIILVAVLRQNDFETIKKILSENGVPGEKILYAKPHDLTAMSI